jgi:hypothetical protein
MDTSKNKQTYHIAFDTKSRPGFLLAAKVTIETDVVLDDETVNIGLVDHLLYKELQTYVKANPR